MKTMTTWILLPASLGLLAACACGSKSAKNDTVYTALVSARFVSADADVNRQAHDDVASETEKAARDRGDIAHKVALSLEDPQDFLAVDLWTSLSGMETHFSDPELGAELAGVFEGPPDVTAWTTPEGWSNWGDLSPNLGDYVVIVRGTLASEDLETNRTRHNQAADGGKETALALGDHAHLVHLDPNNPRSFMALDLWSSLEGLQTFFGNEQVQQSFALLFESPPTVTIYTATDYYQW